MIIAEKLGRIVGKYSKDTEVSSFSGVYKINNQGIFIAAIEETAVNLFLPGKSLLLGQITNSNTLDKIIKISSMEYCMLFEVQKIKNEYVGGFYYTSLDEDFFTYGLSFEGDEIIPEMERALLYHSLESMVLELDFVKKEQVMSLLSSGLISNKKMYKEIFLSSKTSLQISTGSVSFTLN